MKFSKKSRYGLRAMIDLAVHSKDELVPLASIAKRNEISLQYLEQIFSSLRKAHIVKSVKGSQGGYYIERNLADITIAEIILAIEGNYELEKEENPQGLRGEQIVIQSLVIDRINDATGQILSEITLQDLVGSYINYQDSLHGMYYI